MSTTTNGHEPGKNTPEKSECPAATGQNAEQTNNAAIFAENDHERKRFATLAARAAIKGHVLQKLGSGYLLSRWGHARQFVDLDTAEAMLRRIEGGRL